MKRIHMTSRIFKALVVIASFGLLCSCDFFNDGEPKYSESIVVAFTEYDLGKAVLKEYDSDAHGIVRDYDISIDCKIKRIVRWDTSSSQDKEWFKAKCDKYGDNHYNQNVADKYTTTHTCSIPDVNAIHVISEDDFDKEHTKGVLLDDCFDIYYKDLKNIIESNYSVLYARTNIKPLDALTNDEMSMLTSSLPAKTEYQPVVIDGQKLGSDYLSLFGLKATKLPTGPLVQHLTIEFTTEYGNTISCPITFDFSKSILAGQ